MAPLDGERLLILLMFFDLPIKWHLWTAKERFSGCEVKGGRASTLAATAGLAGVDPGTRRAGGLVSLVGVVSIEECLSRRGRCAYRSIGQLQAGS